jgi:hypothetical protein
VARKLNGCARTAGAIPGLRFGTRITAWNSHGNVGSAHYPLKVVGFAFRTSHLDLVVVFHDQNFKNVVAGKAFKFIKRHVHTPVFKKLVLEKISSSLMNCQKNQTGLDTFRISGELPVWRSEMNRSLLPVWQREKI